MISDHMFVDPTRVRDHLLDAYAICTPHGAHINLALGTQHILLHTHINSNRYMLKLRFSDEFT
jgi:hypothetical protein